MTDQTLDNRELGGVLGVVGKPPILRNFRGGVRIFIDTTDLAKTIEIRKILMEGHRERERLTPAITGG